MSVISSYLTYATKMETQGGTRVTLLDTNGNARTSADARNGDIFIFFRALAFTHLFALHTCELGQRKCAQMQTQGKNCMNVWKSFAFAPASQVWTRPWYKFWESTLCSQKWWRWNHVWWNYRCTRISMKTFFYLRQS